MESEAPARDFSRLSVSNNPPPPSRKHPISRKLEPIDFSRLGWNSISFTAGRNGFKFNPGFVGNRAHKHLIKFDGNKFTVNDGPERDIDDPANAEFLESIRNYRIPEEFAEDGLHLIRMVRTCKESRKAAAEAVSKEPLGGHLKYMAF